MHNFIFEDSPHAAEWKAKVLHENEDDYSKTILTQQNTALTPGSEFRVMAALEQLLKYRSNYQEIKGIITGGCLYPTSSDPLETVCLNDLHTIIARGNYRSADNPTAKPIVREKYLKEITKSWMIPIPISYLPNLKDAEFIPIGLAFQKTIDEKGTIIDKERLIHDLFLVTESGTPINHRTIDSLFSECVFGQCLRRILHRIHSMRIQHPSTRIYISHKSICHSVQPSSQSHYPICLQFPTINAVQNHNKIKT